MNKPDVRRFKLGEEVGILSVWLVVLLALCLLSERFRTYSNLQILLLNGSVIAFLASG
jgi:ribose transport system permease protein